jgi:uncharacterized protein involved in outer membrane biogenesis
MLLSILDVFDRQLIANPLQAMVEDRIHRELRLEEVDLRWGLPMSLHVGTVTLANAPWAGDRPMLKASAASISLSPLELIDGPPYARIELENPQVGIARSEQGEWNWQLDTGTAEPNTAPSLPVTLHVDGGSIIVRTGNAFTIDLQRLSLTTADNVEDAQSLEFVLDASRAGIPLGVDARLDLAPSRYSGKATVRAGESSLSTTFAIDVPVKSSRKPVGVQAKIDAGVLVLAELASLMPANDTDNGERTMPLPRLSGFTLNIEAGVDSLRLPALTVSDVQAGLALEDGVAQLDLAEAKIGDATITAHAVLDTSAEEPVLRVEADLARSELSSLPEDLRIASWPGEVSARVRARVEMPQRQVPLTVATALSKLAVPDSRFLYARQDGDKSAEVVLNLQVLPAGGEPSINLELKDVEAPPFEVVLSAPPLKELALPALRYPVELAVSTAGAEAVVSADLAELLREPGMHLEFSVSGEELPRLPAFDFAPPPVPQFSASGSLHQQGEQWELTDAEVSWGESRLSGSALYEPAPQDGNRPMINVEAHASRLDVSRLFAEGGGTGTAPAAPEEDGGTTSLAKLLNTVDAEIQLSADRVQVTEEFAIRDARIAASLENGYLQTETLAFDFSGGHVEGNLDAEASGSSVEGELTLEADALRPAAISETLEPLGDEFRRVSGQLQLSVSGESPHPASESLMLPTLGHVSLGQTYLRLRNEEAATDVTLTLSTVGLDAAKREQRLRVEGTGRYRGEPVAIELHGGPLAVLRKPQEPYELDLSFRVGGVEATLDGQVQAPWSPTSAHLRFSVSAQQPGLIERWLAPWYDVSLPAFEAGGRLNYAGDRRRLSISEFDADFGQSDLHGNLSLDWSAEAPAITASLRSNEMQLHDLTARTGEDEEAEEISVGASDGGVLPPDTFDLGMLRKASADIRYEAADFDAGSIALGSITAQLRLEDGHLVAEPVLLEAAGGKLDLRLDLQTTESALQGVVDVEARGVNLARLLEQDGSSAFGVVGGQGKFWLRGDSVAALAASADGGLLLLMTGGTLNSLLVELASLDIGEALLAAVGLTGPVSIDCGYVSLHSNAGIVDVYRFVVDTSDTTFFLNGEIDLQNETLDLTLYPQSKDAGFPAAEAAITVGGTLAEPQVGLEEEDLAGLALGALALGAVAGPAGALLPLLELGLQDEPPVCSGWVERLERTRHDGA